MVKILLLFVVIHFTDSKVQPFMVLPICRASVSVCSFLNVMLVNIKLSLQYK